MQIVEGNKDDLLTKRSLLFIVLSMLNRVAAGRLQAIQQTTQWRDEADC